MDIELRLIKTDDFVVAFKPSGVPTHRTDVGQMGFVEMLEDRLQEKLYIVHRLDKETSGVLIVARNPLAATELTNLFAGREVTKKYLFKTQHKSDRDKIKFKTLIEKHGKQMVSIRDQEPNSETVFSRIKTGPAGEIWEAQPRTGRTHQIRLHAKDLKIPVDGDRLYGGSQFPRLCLQSQEIEFNWKDHHQKFSAPNPVWLETPYPLEYSVKESIQRRSFLYDDITSSCLRLVHTENLRFRIDQFGDHWWVYWYDEELPTDGEINIFHKLALEYEKKIWLREMTPRGGKNNEKAGLLAINNPNTRWQATELGVTYEFRSDQGMSPGLFLDQRVNRQWVKKNSEGKRVLNLFSYTGGFSVNAALGKASRVVTIDLSSNFNKWAQVNFELNGLDPKEARFNFWAIDSMSFLGKSIKRKEEFDIIICDPPSFGRFDGGVFQIQRDWQEMLEQIIQVLAPGGKLLFSTNYERWNYDLFFNKIEVFAMKKGLKVEKTPLSGFDFELANESPLLKSVFLVKP